MVIDLQTLLIAVVILWWNMDVLAK